MSQATELIANEVAKVLSENETYQSYKNRWRYLLESYIGGDEYRRAGHLVRYQTETDSEYQARLQTTPLDNHCQSIVSIYTSFLFREKPIRTLNSIENSLFVQDFLKDCDYENRSLDHFMKDISVWASVFGHAWAMVIKPNTGAQTQADEMQLNARPYLTMLTPLVVVDWEWSRDQIGRYTLSYFKYIEDINGDVYTVKEWTPELIKTSVVDSIKRTFVEPITIEENSLGEIPAVLVYNKRSSVRGIGVSDIKDIADQQRFIYNAKSEAEQSIRLNTHPSLVKTENTQAGIGAGSIILLDESMDPALKPYLLEFNGASIESIYHSIEQAVDMINGLANVGSLRSTEARRQSGVAQEQEFQLLNARLSDKANSLELAEEHIWRLWCRYQQVEYDAQIEYPDSFNVRDNQHLMEMLLTAQTAIVPSDTYRRELAKQIASLIVEEEAQLSQIAEEIDTAPTGSFQMLENIDMDTESDQDNDDDEETFEPHWMIEPNQGLAEYVETEARHQELAEQGWIHSE